MSLLITENTVEKFERWLIRLILAHFLNLHHGYHVQPRRKKLITKA